MSRRAAARLALLRARRATLNRVASPASRILVVCHGNIYRSAFLGALLANASPARCSVRSAGFHPRPGRPSPDRLVACAAAAGVDLAAHRSRVITPDDVRWADLIVIMDRHNWQGVRGLGACMTNVVWAGALDGGRIEIADPYHASDRALADTVARLARCGERLLAAIPARA